MTAPLVAIDTETDGLGPDRQVYEVAWIRRDPDGTESSATHFLGIDVARSDPFALRVGRYWDRHPHGIRVAHPEQSTHGARITQSATVTRALARATHGAVIIGANPCFDTEALAQLLRANGEMPAWNHRLVDVYPLAAGYLTARDGTPVLPPYKPAELTAALGVDEHAYGNRHEALTDCRWALALYDAVMNGTRIPETDSSNGMPGLPPKSDPE